MTLTAQQAIQVNDFIQNANKSFNAFEAIQKFPFLKEIAEWTKENTSTRGMSPIVTFLFVGGDFHSQTADYDEASDFLMDTDNSQGFQVNYLTGLMVSPFQEK